MLLKVIYSKITLILIVILCGFTVAAGSYGYNAPWRTLQHLCNTVGSTNVYWDNQVLCISNNQNRVCLYHQQRRAEVNGSVVWLNKAPEGSLYRKEWRIAGVDLDLLRLAILPQPEGSMRKMHIMLDPGHGGTDDGAICHDPHIKEKDLNLTMARLIGTRLKKEGFKVSYTRYSDITLSLVERSRLARIKKADLFISVHANHAANKSAQGVETFVLTLSGHSGTPANSKPRGWQIGNRNDYQNTMLGFLIHRELAPLYKVDRGLKRQSFHVLRETTCPAVLLELGFLSNQEEAKRMQQSKWQSDNASAVAAGIVAYARRANSLEQALTAKRAEDEISNQRWRKHLAAQQLNSNVLPEVSSDTSPTAFKKGVPQEQVVSGPEHDVLPLPDPDAIVRLEPVPVQKLLQDNKADISPAHLTLPEGNQPAHLPAQILTGTNAPPVKIDALLDFYEPLKK